MRKLVPQTNLAFIAREGLVGFDLRGKRCLGFEAGHGAWPSGNGATKTLGYHTRRDGDAPTAQT
jgi:hypothetical protein